MLERSRHRIPSIVEGDANGAVEDGEARSSAWTKASKAASGAKQLRTSVLVNASSSCSKYTIYYPVLITSITTLIDMRS
jgi:hypothetical protein